MTAYADESVIEKRSPNRIARLAILGIPLAFFAWTIGVQATNVWLNLSEFGELFVKPIYFGFLGGSILATIALFRIDFVSRRSIAWWLIRLVSRLLRSRGSIEALPPEYFEFSNFKLSPVKFGLWQVTKVLFGLTFFMNVMFGMAVNATMQGWNSGSGGLPSLLSLPFVTPPPNMVFAQANVIPLIPSLTLLIPPILAAIGMRLLLLVGVTNIIRIIAPTIISYSTEQPSRRLPIATIEALIAIGLLWTMTNLFFPSYIDFNTRYLIIGSAVAGFFFIIFAVLDRHGRKLLLMPPKRSIYLRAGAIVIVALLVGSVAAVNSSIADARKLEWLGPYTVQEIGVNRYLAELDDVKEIRYNFSALNIPPTQLDRYVSGQREILTKVRLWDWEAGFAKLKPELGLIPYLDFQDSDVIRFNGSVYWSASMRPILPDSVRSDDRWYASHLVYTHVPNGFLILDAQVGDIINTDKFFQQRRIYYGEGGLLRNTWAAYPVNRENSDELGEYFYDGKGGIAVPPPLSWIFEPNFLLSYPDRTIQTLRYRDVYDRMQLLFPYFEYSLFGEPIDMYPVTDGENTYWAMPLIVALDTRHVPWSGGNPFIRFVGYALIDTYNGDTSFVILGNDYFSELFKMMYSDNIVTEMPEWFQAQARYPEEFFEWRVSMYNFYHVTDLATFISAKEFYVVPEGLDTYYIIAKPPGFDKPEFLGLLSLELRGAAGRNLAGYMIVGNDHPNFGQMTFYKVPLDSTTRLLGPTGVREALERDPDFATLRTLLRTPRLGDNILYRIGDHDVYFIPVYTAPGGGVVTQIGTVAAVGAAFTGQYHVGLGNTAEEAFRVYLAKTGGIELSKPEPELDVEQRKSRLRKDFQDRGLTLATPVSTFPEVSFSEGEVKYVSEADWDNARTLADSFVDKWVKSYSISRILTWSEDSRVNFGVLVRVEGLLELHYITILLS
ncbi:MAG: UPF0182 family protein [Thaumarchaeota archaeon]|nr:UPF0182 family protein [Nitrososphaerota archaeon]